MKDWKAPRWNIATVLRATWSASLKMWARTPARPQARQRGGAALRRRSQGWETCPGYLPNYTWLPWRASSWDLYSRRSEDYGPYLKRENRGRLFPFPPPFSSPPWNIHFGQVAVARAVAVAKFSQQRVFLRLGVAVVGKLRLSTGSLFVPGLKVRRGYCSLRYRQTAPCQRKKINNNNTGLTPRERPWIFTGVPVRSSDRCYVSFDLQARCVFSPLVTFNESYLSCNWLWTLKEAL